MGNFLDSSGLTRVWNKISSTYLSKSGGTMTGDITTTDMNVGLRYKVDYLSGWARSFISFYQHTDSNGNKALEEVFKIGSYGGGDGYIYSYIGGAEYSGNNLRFYKNGDIKIGDNIVYHAGNIPSYASASHTHSYISQNFKSDGLSNIPFTAERFEYGILTGGSNSPTDLTSFDSYSQVEYINLPWYGNEFGGQLMFGANSGKLGFRTRHSGTWNTIKEVIHSGNIGSQSVNYATNSTKLYASDSPYRYGDSAPYYAYFTYNDYSDNRWYMRVSPATPADIRVDYANSAGSVAWGNVSNKPSTFTPSSHEHAYITSPYQYTGRSTYNIENESINDSATSDILTRNYKGTLFPVFHTTDWGWSDTLYWSGYDKWGGTELATQYNADSNVRVKIRKFYQGTMGWGSWTEFITSGNIGSQSVNYATSAGSVAWSNVSSKPSSFTPSSHNHSYLTQNFKSDGLSNIPFTSERFEYGILTGGSGSPSDLTSFDPYSQVEYINLPWYSNTYGGQLMFGANSGKIGYRTIHGGTWTTIKEILHSGNYSSYALPLSGGTVSGNIYATGTITAGSASDIRLKENISELNIHKVLNILRQLKPKKFNWNSLALELDPMKDKETTHLGYIAQEVEKLIPSAVTDDYFEVYKRLNPLEIIPLLHAAIVYILEKLQP